MLLSNDSVSNDIFHGSFSLTISESSVAFSKTYNEDMWALTADTAT